MKRGQIKYRQRRQQILDCSGMVFERDITPSDLDGGLVFRNDHDGSREFILSEIKLKGVEVPTGQRIFLEEMIRALGKSGPAIAIVAEHEVPVDEDIDMAECIVRSFFSDRTLRWVDVPRPLPHKGFIDAWRARERIRRAS